MQGKQKRRLSSLTSRSKIKLPLLVISQPSKQDKYISGGFICQILSFQYVVSCSQETIKFPMDKPLFQAGQQWQVN